MSRKLSNDEWEGFVIKYYGKFWVEELLIILSVYF